MDKIGVLGVAVGLCAGWVRGHSSPSPRWGGSGAVTVTLACGPKGRELFDHSLDGCSPYSVHRHTVTRVASLRGRGYAQRRLSASTADWLASPPAGDAQVPACHLAGPALCTRRGLPSAVAFFSTTSGNRSPMLHTLVYCSASWLAVHARQVHGKS